MVAHVVKVIGTRNAHAKSRRSARHNVVNGAVLASVQYDHKVKLGLHEFQGIAPLHSPVPCKVVGKDELAA